MYRLLSLLISLFIAQHVLCQVPKEASVLNYRLIGFSFPEENRVKRYQLEIAKGNFFSEDSFKKNVVRTVENKSTKITVEVPFFGVNYTWRVISFAQDNAEIKGAFHHFRTGIIPDVDTSKLRFRIISPAEKYSDAFIFLDGNRVLYDMNGRPVWYLPNIEGMINEVADVKDLKMTPQGTITFLLNDKFIYEIDYDGNILWKGPSNGSIINDIHYHHEFTRLANGHYMTLITEPVMLRHNLASQPDSGDVISTDQEMTDSLHSLYQTYPFTVIVEYDANGNIVWKWRTADYLYKSDIYYRIPPIHRNRYDVYANSFFFDEKNSVVYLSFRNLNRILKIKYPEGTVLRSYGETFKPTMGTLNGGLFEGQHSIRVAADGELYLYNNGSNVGAPTTSTIMKIKEPASDDDTLVKTWEYACFVDHPEELKHKFFGNTTGGNVVELPDHSFFVSMSSEYSKVFIVNKKKEVLFSGIPERWDPNQKRWRVKLQHYGSIIPGKDEMDKLIWGSGK